MSGPRQVNVAVHQDELLAFMTGARRLNLPLDTKLISVWNQANDPGEPPTWMLRIEHESFQPVAYRVPCMSADQLNRKMVAHSAIEARRRAS